MMHAGFDDFPVVRDPRDFPAASGSALERAIFEHRPWVLWACLALTLVLGLCTPRLQIGADLSALVPADDPYVRNALRARDDLRGLGHVLRVAVEHTRGDVFDPCYLDTLRRINDELVLTPGVDRAAVKSLWMPALRWNEVTEEGFQGGPVMPDGFDGSAASVQALRRNIERAALVGSIVGDDFRSSVVVVPLLERSADGRGIDQLALAQAVEDIRRRYEQAPAAATTPAGACTAAVRLHMVGATLVAGSIVAGLRQMTLFFAISVVLATALLYLHTRCVRSTLLVVACSLTALGWQLGAMASLGLGLGPYSLLVPFLTFATGVSHGAQKMNGIARDIARGTHRWVAARYTYRRLFGTGVVALLGDAISFAVLLLVPIGEIREVAITACIGIAIPVFTNLVLLPVLLSHVGVSPRAASASVQGSGGWQGRVLQGLAGLARHRDRAATALAVAALLAAAGLAVGSRLSFGDLDRGAPELRPSSRYNQDDAWMGRHYGASSDAMVVILRTPPDGCLRYETLLHADRLAWELRQLPSVRATQSLPDVVRQVTAATFDASPKWLSLVANPQVLAFGVQEAIVNGRGLADNDCSVMPVIAFLADHRADTLAAALETVERFIREHPVPAQQLQVLPIAGPAGLEAVTNRTLQRADRLVLPCVFAGMFALCLAWLRDARAALVALAPLALTSVLCQALMVVLGIGIKVGTLPVIALGVGTGVDYALYLLSVQLALQRDGLPVDQACERALAFTGRVVALVGVTMSAGVVTWAFSPIKFQADMGLLLAFVFIVNMVGALVLVPALSPWLLGDASRA